MARNIPYSFTAKMVDGRTLCEGDKPLMAAEDASSREIEQLILERLEDEGDVLTMRWVRMSDWNMRP